MSQLWVGSKRARRDAYVAARPKSQKTLAAVEAQQKKADRALFIIAQLNGGAAEAHWVSGWPAQAHGATARHRRGPA